MNLQFLHSLKTCPSLGVKANEDVYRQVGSAAAGAEISHTSTVAGGGSQSGGDGSTSSSGSGTSSGTSSGGSTLADELSLDEQARMLRQHLLMLSQANTRIREAMQYADESIMVVVARDTSMNQEHIPDKEKVLMLF